MAEIEAFSTDDRNVFHCQVTQLVDMGERTLDPLLQFLHQNGGHLGDEGRDGEFGKLTVDETARVEAIYSELTMNVL